MITPQDRLHLARCIELATEALNAGDAPFGSLLVLDDQVRFEARNRTRTGNDATLHPEFEIARWTAAHLSEEERARAVVYTSGEHCPMCAAAHGWVGLGRIVYASSSRQLVTWLGELGAPENPVQALTITEILRNADVDGPVEGLDEEVRRLHAHHATLNQSRE
ncbi:nucleoside deaminase [Lujinxingia vulgaris]|uniref:Nucleoside deaminase n=1 Tax=Lujinxingia vulgaris TaxID=2600176 RepID=A0A5C6X826_9DELT|nr:nucleoside deaminase [Lujinxingia vulgaris]TXD34903.1 nucleoside deaminase [Lujinxingia vulgaris]